PGLSSLASENRDKREKTCGHGLCCPRLRCKWGALVGEPRGMWHGGRLGRRGMVGRQNLHKTYSFSQPSVSGGLAHPAEAGAKTRATPVVETQVAELAHLAI